MTMIRAAIGGIVGGAIGAAVWAAVAYYAHFEIGWIAWGVGLLVGLGVSFGASDDKGLPTGVMAVVLALASICAGKLAAVHFGTRAEMTRLKQTDLAVDERQVKLYIARSLVDEYTQQNKPLRWPAGKDADSAETPIDFPADLWNDAQRRWDAMGQQGRDEYAQRVRDMVHGRVDEAGATVTLEAFKASFGVMDLLFFGLAVFTAFKLGAGVISEEE